MQDLFNVRYVYKFSYSEIFYNKIVPNTNCL
ncbi:MAG: hypothetical protein JWQ38_426 [Flavipsychrobacter sp.]|nr:hypothetical protein [Flavipsychrobacter sp.]